MTATSCYLGRFRRVTLVNEAQEVSKPSFATGRCIGVLYIVKSGLQRSLVTSKRCPQHDDAVGSVPW
jgi:hypothetical protein